MALFTLLRQFVFQITYTEATASTYELATGHTRSIEDQLSKKVHPEVKAARRKLIAKRKLNMIIRMKATKVPIRNEGDLLQVYVKLKNDKKG